MKNKKGFTLIELLAVIVILAIIALIATPIILNMIENAKKNAAIDSAYGYIEAVETYVTLSEIDSEKYKVNDLNKNGNNSVKALNSLVSIKGSKPTSGVVTLKNNKVQESIIKINGYEIYYDGTKAEVETIDKVTPNYGTQMQEHYETLYSNISGSDSLVFEHRIDNRGEVTSVGNYDYMFSLDKYLTKNNNYLRINGGELEMPTGACGGYQTRVFSGTNDYMLTKESSNRWIFINMNAGCLTTNVNISEFKLIFKDKKVLTLKESVEQGYIEPLVIVGSERLTKYSWLDLYNIVDGGATSISNYSNGIIIFKVKEKSSLTGYRLATNKNWRISSSDGSGDGVEVLEFDENTELSLSPLR